MDTMDTNLLNALNQIAKTDILNIILTFVLTAIVILLIKVVAESIAGFIQLRLDQHLAIGSLVELYGRKGRIKEVSLFTITIETENEFIRVPTKQWRFKELLILKDRVTLRNRRRSDKDDNSIEDDYYNCQIDPKDCKILSNIK